MEDAARGATATKALRDPATLLAAVLATAGLVQSWDLGRRSPGIDFYQFWVVGQLIGRADVPSIYAEEAHPRLGAEFIRRSLTDDDSERRRAAARAWQVLEPTATPMLYSAFRPFAGLRYDDAHLVFRILSLAALEVIRSEYPTVTDFEREFSIALFRTSYRRWQNAIDGRFYQLSASGTRHQ